MEIKRGELHVLMIGPGPGVGGGISTLIETLLPILTKRISTYYLFTVNSRQLMDSGKFSLQNIVIALSQYYRFLVALSQFNPTIMHLHTSQGLAWLKDTFFIIICKVINCRVILHIHGGNFDDIYDRSCRLLKMYTRRILSLADSVIAVSTEWKNRLSRFIRPDKIITLPNCIDCQIIQPNPSRAYIEKVNILFMGRVGLNKGVFDLIDALHLIHTEGISYYAQIVGDEEKKGDYERLNQRLEKYRLTNRCETIGSVDREIALQLLKDASVFVLPSYYEGLPMVILEALASGLPVVATPVGGIPEVVRDGYNGYLVPVGNVQLLARQLGKLAKDSELRNLMGQRSREIAEKELIVETYVDKLIGLYTHITAK